MSTEASNPPEPQPEGMAPPRRARWVRRALVLVAVLGVVVSGRLGDALDPSVYPLELPQLPVAAAIGVALAALPAWIAPEPPELATAVAPQPAEGLEVAA